jgi:hypothetical protein
MGGCLALSLEKAQAESNRTVNRKAGRDRGRMRILRAIKAIIDPYLAAFAMGNNCRKLFVAT